MCAASTLPRRIERKIALTLLRSIQLVRIFAYRRLSTAIAQGRPMLHQPVQLVGDGAISFGDGVQIGVFPSPFYLTSHAYLEARCRTAAIEVGRGSHINNGFVAVAEHTTIRIGSNVLIGTHVEIYDSDFHGLHRDERKISTPAMARPVAIGNDVFLGSNVKVLKGVSIGAGSVVANGSIVIHDIPENVIAGGIPARVLRSLE